VQTIPWDAAEEASAPRTAQRGDDRTLLMASGVALLAFVVGGVVSALLWLWFADLPYSVVEEGNAYQGAQQLERQFGIDAAFTWAALLVAVPLGALVGLRWHRVGWPLAFTLMLAAAVASVIAWQLGGLLGPEEPSTLLAEARNGDRLYDSLRLHARGLLLAPPVGALVGFIAAVAVVGDRDPRVEWDRRQAPRRNRPDGPLAATNIKASPSRDSTRGTFGANRASEERM
jgi:hypothetical protein